MQSLNGFQVPASCASEVLSLAKRHPHARDKNIAFDEEPHTYYIYGQTAGWVSVTTVVHEFFPAFNGQRVAQRMVRSPKFCKDKKYDMYQKYRLNEDGSTATESVLISRILQSWTDNANSASALGTKLHRSIELFYNAEPTDNKSSEFMNHFYDFVAVQMMLDLEPFRTEWMIYSEDEQVCGSIDCIMRCKKTGKYAMFDWKRSKQIRMKGFGGKGKGPVAHLQDCNYIHYSLQLNLYKYILEKNYGIYISTMNIVVFHPNNPTFLSFEIKDMQPTIKTVLESRSSSTAQPTSTTVCPPADILAMFPSV